MRTRISAAMLALCIAALAAAPSRAADDAAAAAAKAALQSAWVYPQDVKCAGRRLTLHEPQVVSFDAPNFRISLRFPAMLTDPLGRSTYGMVEVAGAVHFDPSSRLVRLDALEAGKTAFPGAAEVDAKAAETGLADALPKSVTLRTELLTARAGAYSLPSTPPKLGGDIPAIVVRARPAVLVQVDGEPVMLDVETFPIQYLANSASDVFRDPKTDMWYLLLDGSWLQAKALAGPWKKSDGSMPSAMSQIPATHPRGHVRRYVGGTPEFMKRGMVPAPKELPEVIVTDKPSELMLLQGDPMFTWVPGLRLMSVANTESDLFLHPKANLYYLLIAGRWFSSVELEGPWTAAETLPEEFTRIPRDHIRGHVVWCVPGTPEASEACAHAAMEERATLSKYAKAELLVEGKEPVTAALDGDVKMVTNTEDDCFVVDGVSYLSQRGTWYRSDDGLKGWKACAEIPESLRNLPAPVPGWHTTFCRPIGFEGDNATFALGAGWYGVFAWKGSPVYGTGTTRRGMSRTGSSGANWYPSQRSYGENRWYDPATGIFQPRTVRPREGGTTSADEWSPYTASYGRVVYYGSRYDQGGRRMYPYSSDEMKFDTSSARPDIYAVWMAQVKKRENLDLTLFPFGDRSAETAPAEARLATDESGRVWRIGAKGPEFAEKGGWTNGKPAAEIVAWLDTLARIDARPALWKRWRELRAAPVPVNPVVTMKAK